MMMDLFLQPSPSFKSTLDMCFAVIVPLILSLVAHKSLIKKLTSGCSHELRVQSIGLIEHSYVGPHFMPGSTTIMHQDFGST